MKFSSVITCGLIAASAPAFAGNGEWTCPEGNQPSIQRQGNAETRSCLDAQGKPDGLFEVWAWPDSLAPTSAILLFRGRFDHGERKGEWMSFSEKGALLESGEFLKNRKAGPVLQANAPDAGDEGEDK